MSEQTPSCVGERVAVAVTGQLDGVNIKPAKRHLKYIQV